MTATALAQQWLAQPTADASITDVFARDLVRAHEDLAALRERCTALHAELAHANEQLRERPKAWVPAVHIRCDGRCGAVVAFDPAPEEARMVAALAELGWSMDGGHWCRRCR